MSGWIHHPEFGRVRDSGCVVIVDDPVMLDEPPMREWIAAEEHVSVCSMDQWMQHIAEEYRKDRLGTAIREAELEDWHDRAEQLRQLRI